jgi:hypothetical protein
MRVLADPQNDSAGGLNSAARAFTIGSVSQYDFKNLSPHDFEVLVHGLMEATLEARLERFSPGRDAGIDLRAILSRPNTARPSTPGLRYLAPEDHELIIQCKHHASSSFSTLLSNLRKEKPKIDALAPERYVLVTSQRLTPGRKDDILEVLAPHIRGSEDIYGEAEVNGLLEAHPQIEQRNFKLWLTSTAVLQRVLNNDIFVRAQQLQTTIERKLRVYVQNASFLEARDVLSKRHACIIAGVPGIGKTMLADMLLVALVSEGFEAVAVSDDISEALKLYARDRPQVFYYDDFLGQTTSLDKLGKNEDQRLLDFIAQVEQAGNKRLILTTREYMLTQARLRYERLDRADFDVAKCVIALEDYTRLDRATILYNHVYFSELAPAYYGALTTARSYMKIIEHPNYSPRIIDTVNPIGSKERSRSRRLRFILSGLAQSTGFHLATCVREPAF